MLELRFIRENIELVKENIKHRGITSSGIDSFIDIDQQRRDQLSEVESLRNKRKTVSQEIAALKKKEGKCGRSTRRNEACQFPDQGAGNQSVGN